MLEYYKLVASTSNMHYILIARFFDYDSPLLLVVDDDDDDDDMKFGDQGNNPKNDDVIYEETASYPRQKITLLVSFLKCDPQKQCKNCGCCQTNA